MLIIYIETSLLIGNIRIYVLYLLICNMVYFII